MRTEKPTDTPVRLYETSLGAQIGKVIFLKTQSLVKSVVKTVFPYCNLLSLLTISVAREMLTSNAVYL